MEEGFKLCGLPLVSAHLLLGFLSAHCVSIATICHLFLSWFSRMFVILIRHAAFYERVTCLDTFVFLLTQLYTLCL